MKITGEQIFGINDNYFTVSACEVPYTLQFSVDKAVWTDANVQTPANEAHIVSGCPKNLFWRLKDNTGEALIQW